MQKVPRGRPSRKWKRSAGEKSSPNVRRKGHFETTVGGNSESEVALTEPLQELKIFSDEAAQPEARVFYDRIS